MNILARIGLGLLVIVSAFLGQAAPSAASQGIAVSGIVWYDDNRNGILDPGEEAAGQVTVVVLVGSYAGHGRQPTPVAATVADPGGRFRVAFQPDAGKPASLRSSAMRPGYPYPAIQSSPYDNYRSPLVAIPLTGATDVGVPLQPIRGVLERLPAGAPADFPIPEGRFFTQTNGYLGGSALGFPVTNAGGVPFWDTWQRFGLENVGYPLSDRFVWRGFLHQVFQKAVFQWRPDLSAVAFVNLFDELHDLQLDALLRERALTPIQLDPAFDAGKSWAEIVRDRLALLDANPAIKDRYFAAPDPLLLYGLPTSRVEDLGAVAVIRTQRTVLQHWKVEVPFARAGEVTVSNGGEIAKEHAIFFPTAPPYPDLFQPRLP